MAVDILIVVAVGGFIVFSIGYGLVRMIKER